MRFLIKSWQQILIKTYISTKIGKFGKFLDILAQLHIFSSMINLEFSFIAELFTDQSSKYLEVADKINIAIVIN